MESDSLVPLRRSVIIIYFGIKIIYGFWVEDNRFHIAYRAHDDHISIYPRRFYIFTFAKAAFRFHSNILP